MFNACRAKEIVIRSLFYWVRWKLNICVWVCVCWTSKWLTYKKRCWRFFSVQFFNLFNDFPAIGLAVGRQKLLKVNNRQLRIFCRILISILAYLRCDIIFFVQNCLWTLKKSHILLYSTSSCKIMKKIL